MPESADAAVWENQGPAEQDNMADRLTADWPERASAAVAAAHYTGQMRQQRLAVA